MIKKKFYFCLICFLVHTFKRKQIKNKNLAWECHVHAAMKFEEIKNLRDEYPDSEVLIHPECACGSQAMLMAERTNDKSIHFYLLKL